MSQPTSYKIGHKWDVFFNVFHEIDVWPIFKIKSHKSNNSLKLMSNQLVAPKMFSRSMFELNLSLLYAHLHGHNWTRRITFIIYNANTPILIPLGKSAFYLAVGWKMLGKMCDKIVLPALVSTIQYSVVWSFTMWILIHRLWRNIVSVVAIYGSQIS